MSVEQKEAIRVLLADDHPIVRTGFSMSLASFGIKVVGEAKSPDEVIKMYPTLLPDVVVLDIRFGVKQTGLDVAKEILRQHPGAKIVLLSQFDQDSLIKETYKIGARAFVTKNCDPAELALAIRRAHENKVFFLPEIAERLASLSVLGDHSPQALLEERELEVFVLMAKGLTNVEIAEKLDLSPKTISNVSQTIKETLCMHRPADITRLAVKHELIEP